MGPAELEYVRAAVSRIEEVVVAFVKSQMLRLLNRPVRKPGPLSIKTKPPNT